MSGNGIGHEGAEAIADALRGNATLKRLSLTDNYISVGGAEATAAETPAAETPAEKATRLLEEQQNAILEFAKLEIPGSATDKSAAEEDKKAEAEKAASET